MGRHSDVNDKPDKSQGSNKQNSSSGFETANSKNTGKNVPERPFNVGGKDIYVIDPPSDIENVDVKVFQNSCYEDRSAVLHSSKWPECAGPQAEMLNGVFDEVASGGSSNSSYSKQGRSSTRTKSSNPLDHINQDSRNANKNNIPSSHAATSHYSLRRSECFLLVLQFSFFFFAVTFFVTEPRDRFVTNDISSQLCMHCTLVLP